MPEAECEDAIRLRVGDDYGLVHESGLPLQNGQDLVIDGIAQLACSSGLAGYFNNPGKHGKRSFRLVKKVKGTSRSVRAARTILNPTNLRRFVGSVNCPKLVQWPQMRLSGAFLRREGRPDTLGETVVGEISP